MKIAFATFLISLTSIFWLLTIILTGMYYYNFDWNKFPLVLPIVPTVLMFVISVLSSAFAHDYIQDNF